MRKSSNLFWGIIFILFGIFILAYKVFNLGFLSMGNLWPAFVLIPGLAFEFSYFTSRTNPGILVPGGILTVIGILFFVQQDLIGWEVSDYTWPVYLLAVAFGLFQMYIFSKNRNNGVLIPVFILTLIAVIYEICYAINGASRYINFATISGAILFILGIYIIIKGCSKKN